MSSDDQAALDELFRAYFDMELKRFLGALNKGPDIIAHCPSNGYRRMMVDVVHRLRDKGYHVLCVSSAPLFDDFARLDNSFFLDQFLLLDIFSGREKVPLYITPTLQPGGLGKKNLVFIHDIWDSPLGENDHFRQDAAFFDYLLVPSRPAIIMYQQVLSHAPETWRQVPKQTLIPCGYPKLDDALERIGKVDLTTAASIVYAPTVSMLSNADMFGMKILLALSRHFKTREIIFRPHPHDYGQPAIKAIIDFCGRRDNITVDLDSGDNFSSYIRSTVLVTDISGTAYTFAFSQLRPVVFFQPKGLGCLDEIKDRSYVTSIPEVGALVETVDDLGAVIDALEAEGSACAGRIERLRDDSLFNLGHALDYFMDHIPDIIEGRRVEGWIEIA